MNSEVGGRRFDPELGRRYFSLIETGKRLFERSGLVDPYIPITHRDLDRINIYHELTDPTDQGVRYRLNGFQSNIPPTSVLHDWSTYDRWHEPGGFAEHRDLVKQGIFIIADMVRKNLRDAEEFESEESWQRQMIYEFRALRIPFVAAGAFLHDEGRQLTHLLPTNDYIAKRLLAAMRIRPDIVALFPDISIFKKDESEMVHHFVSRGGAALLVEIADNFCKRAHTPDGRFLDRLMIPSDYQYSNRQWWIKSYMAHDPTGRPTERWMRQHIEEFAKKGYSYIEAMDKMIKETTTISLAHIVRELYQKLLPTIPKEGEV